MPRRTIGSESGFWTARRCSTAHVRPTFFAEWLDWYWGTDGASGVIRLPMGDGRHAPIAGEDQAYVIAAPPRTSTEQHDRKIYPLVEPVEMNQDGIAEALSRALEIPVHYEPIGIAEFTEGDWPPGFPAPLVQHLGAVVQDYRDGIFAGTNDYIETIGGKTPMTVEEYAQAHREAFSHDGPYAIPAHGDRVMIDTIGIIGSGEVAQALAHHALSAGYAVSLSNSRGPDSLAATVAALGDGARAVTVPEAAEADLVIVAVPFVKVPDLTAAVPDWSGRLVVDVTNQFAEYQPAYSGFVDLGEETGSEWVARHLPGATVIKAFNTLYASYIAANPRHPAGRQIVFYAGDDDTPAPCSTGSSATRLRTSRRRRPPRRRQVDATRRITQRRTRTEAGLTCSFRATSCGVLPPEHTRPRATTCPRTGGDTNTRPTHRSPRPPATP